MKTLILACLLSLPAQALSTLTYCLESQTQYDMTIISAFEWWASQGHFAVMRTPCNYSSATIKVRFAKTSGDKGAYSWCESCGWQGHTEDAIQLDTRQWNHNVLRWVVGHEAGHIILRMWGHSAYWLSIMYYTHYYQGWTLTSDELARLRQYWPIRSGGGSTGRGQ